MLTIYGVPISVHVRKALITANLKGIPHRVEPVIPFNPPADWNSLSPTGLIPAMTDEDFTLAESTAICSYLEDKQPKPSILGHDAKARSRVLFFDGYAGYVFRSLVHGLFFQKVINPVILKGSTDQAAVDNLLTTVAPKLFGYLEGQANSSFLVGDTLTLADIGIVSNLINFQYLGLGIDKAKYPQLAQYTARLTRLDVFRTTLAKERPFAEQMRLDHAFLS
jgi:glutathione S-transferase